MANAALKARSAPKSTQRKTGAGLPPEEDISLVPETVRGTEMLKETAAKYGGCEAAGLLDLWAENFTAVSRLGRNVSPDSVKRQRETDRAWCNVYVDDLSQVVARSNLGAAFQILVAATASPWGRMDDPPGVPDDATDQLVDGIDYMRRLMLGAYIHLARNIGDANLRRAEVAFFAEHMGDSLISYLRESGSQITWREMV